jgi:ABC-type multidrug transport system fused ATPase/permease subunit
MKIVPILCCLIIISSIACAETYKWEDANGIHFTENPNSIPEKYRSKALSEPREDITTSKPQAGNSLPQQRNSVDDQIKQNEENRVLQERARIAVESLKLQQLQNAARNNKLINNQIQQGFKSLTTFITLWVLIGIIVFVAWLSALIDILRSEFINPSNKVVWLIVIFIIPLLGSILYSIFASSQKIGYKSNRERVQAELLERLKPRSGKDQDFDIR